LHQTDSNGAEPRPLSIRAWRVDHRRRGACGFAGTPV